MSRDTTDETRHFDIFFLKKHGKLKDEFYSSNNNIVWSRDGREVARIDYSICTFKVDPFIELSYKVRRRGETDWNSILQKVKMETVVCHLGGKRWYFRCGLFKGGQYCGRRVAVLYQAGDYFGCRHCADLSYASCNESKRMRGFPWKTLSNTWKADELFVTLKRTTYSGCSTKKYRKCLQWWVSSEEVYMAEKLLQKEL